MFGILYRYLFYLQAISSLAHLLDHLQVAIVFSLYIVSITLYELVVTTCYSRPEASPGPVACPALRCFKYTLIFAYNNENLC